MVLPSTKVRLASFEMFYLQIQALYLGIGLDRLLSLENKWDSEEEYGPVLQ